jgi:hypothetical protein
VSHIHRVPIPLQDGGGAFCQFITRPHMRACLIVTCFSVAHAGDATAWVETPNTYCNDLLKDPVTWGGTFDACHAMCVALKGCSEFYFTNGWVLHTLSFGTLATSCTARCCSTPVRHSVMLHFFAQ